MFLLDSVLFETIKFTPVSLFLVSHCSAVHVLSSRACNLAISNRSISLTYRYLSSNRTFWKASEITISRNDDPQPALLSCSKRYETSRAALIFDSMHPARDYSSLAVNAWTFVISLFSPFVASFSPELFLRLELGCSSLF